MTTDIKRLHEVALGDRVGRRAGHTFLRCHETANSLVLGNKLIICAITSPRDIMYIKPMLCDILDEYLIDIVSVNSNKIVTVYGIIKFHVTNKKSHPNYYDILNDHKLLSDAHYEIQCNYNTKSHDSFIFIPMGHFD